MQNHEKRKVEIFRRKESLKVLERKESREPKNIRERLKVLNRLIQLEGEEAAYWEGKLDCSKTYTLMFLIVFLSTLVVVLISKFI